MRQIRILRAVYIHTTTHILCEIILLLTYQLKASEEGQK